MNLTCQKVGSPELAEQKLSCRNSHQRCSVEKGILRNLAKFTRKHFCQILFYSKVAKQSI